MKRFILFTCSLFMVLSPALPANAERSSPLIVDHTCTDLSQVPDEWIERAKRLTLHYAHTSHGSQVTSGISNLESLDAFYAVAIRTSSSEGLPNIEDPPALRIYDGNPPDTYITPEDYWNGESALNRTRAVAATGGYQFSMWSWCGQVSGGTETYIQNYLDALDQLQAEFPEMEFIYMTGHLDGSGSSGTLHRNNERIRDYCRDNNKILFDFADIERYTPDGVDLLDSGADDGCNYDGGNWAQEWCAANPGSDLCDACSCAHSQALNCNRKARAFWWMMARLAGWGDCIEAPTQLVAQADEALGQISLSWSAPSGGTQADSFIVQRRADGGEWETGHAEVAGGTTTYVDSGLGAGTYTYRVVAHLYDNGNGSSCDSGPSNSASATIEGPDSDGDGVPDARDECPQDPSKVEPGQCGCGQADTDSDGDHTADCIDLCPADARKIAPGQCGCGLTDADTDGDQTADCLDQCPQDAGKIDPGVCGCGYADTNTDGDQTADCLDLCPDDPQKTEPGQCGCGFVESDPCNSSPDQDTEPASTLEDGDDDDFDWDNTSCFLNTLAR